MIEILGRYFKTIQQFINTPARVFRSKAIDTLEAECTELEHVFTLLTAGTVVGFPASPLPLTFALLPHMEDEIIALIGKTDTAEHPLSYLFSTLKVN